MRGLNPSEVTLRDQVETDVPLSVDYWFRSPPGFIEGLGVDPAKMPSEEVFTKAQFDRIQKNVAISKSRHLVICLNQVPIGQHTINELTEGETGIFHAHIWDPQFRGVGVGMISYPKACQIFVERFSLKYMTFKTPIQNRASIRVKEKLGISCVGEEIISYSVVRAGTRAKVFEWSREEIARVVARLDG